MRRAPPVCPVCGADVPANARSCRHCGADEATGWSDAPDSGGLDLPGEGFDYDEFIAREFGPARAKPRGVAWHWWVVALLLLGLFALGLIASI